MSSELVRAVAAPSVQLPVVVMLNPGAAYRIGPSRLHVSRARVSGALLAVCVSICPAWETAFARAMTGANDSYSATAFRDIEATLKALKSEPGVNRIVLMGLCSERISHSRPRSKWRTRRSSRAF